MHRHTQTFYNLAYRVLQNEQDAEDTIQRIFINLWQEPHLWDSSKGSKFTTWLYRVVVNKCLDHKRKQQNTIVELHKSTQKDIANNDQQAALIEKETLEIQASLLENWISELPESQQIALNLAVYQQLPQKEVADIMETSVKAVESLLSRAKQTLKKRHNAMKNSTLATVPSVSEALATKGIVCPILNLAPFAGELIATCGGLFSLPQSTRTSSGPFPEGLV